MKNSTSISTTDVTPMEVELKLALPSMHLETLINHPLLATTPPLAQHLANTYFDTPAGELALARIAVRLRQVDGDVLQTVKTAGQGGGGLSSRQEWEWPVPTQQLDLKALAALAPFTGALADVIPHLAPTLRTDFNRRSWQLHWQDSHIELVLDEGEIVSGLSGRSATAPISELELELKAGDPQALWSLALHLADSLPLRPSDSSKAARGNALANQHWPLPEATSPAQWLHRATVALDAYHDSGCADHLSAAQQALATLAEHPQLDGDTGPLARQLPQALDSDGQPSTAYGHTALALAHRLADQSALR